MSNTKVKRGPGRPKGSKNKVRKVVTKSVAKRGRGRPKGSKNKVKVDQEFYVLPFPSPQTEEERVANIAHMVSFYQHPDGRILFNSIEGNRWTPGNTVNLNYFVGQFDNDDNKDDEKDEEMKRNEMTLKMKHILEAEGYIILYDVSDQDSLNKVKNYLDTIFGLKGYNKIKEKLKSDEMCFFPICIIGLNEEKVIDKSKQVSLSEMNQIAMKYCVTHQRMRTFFENTYNGNYAEKRIEKQGICDVFIDYYYYRSLSENEINERKSNMHSSACFIL